MTDTDHIIPTFVKTNLKILAMKHDTQLLIVGAGPFGLSLAAYFQESKINYRIVGRPMSFWKEHMPEGMLLRSDCEWHLDPYDKHTMHAYLETKNLKLKDVMPLSLQFYLDYAKWFQSQKGIIVDEAFVVRLDSIDNRAGRFEAKLDNGETIIAHNVVLALGFEYFKYIPTEIASIIPKERLSHTCDHVEFSDLKEKRCLIVGGRQSAFEWAALLRENEVSHIDLTYRHDTPSFEEADWSWAPALIDSSVASPGYFQRLSGPEQDEIFQRFWGEGRLKLEPWLWPRIDHENVSLWPRSYIVGCQSLPNEDLKITLSNGEIIQVDHVICATGYKVDLSRIPLLSKGNLLEQIKCTDGSPDLGQYFECNIQGLYMTSMPATKDFGLFFAFTVSVLGSTKILGNHLKKTISNHVRLTN